jgi:hypothetical protein
VYYFPYLENFNALIIWIAVALVAKLLLFPFAQKLCRCKHGVFTSRTCAHFPALLCIEIICWTVVTAGMICNAEETLAKFPQKSLRRLPQQTGLSLTSACWRPDSSNYGYTDFNQCMSCNNGIHLQEFNIATGFVDLCIKVLLEVCFHLNGHINSQNSQLWSAENPHTVYKTSCIHWRLACDAQCLEWNLWDHCALRRQLMLNIIRIFWFTSFLCCENWKRLLVSAWWGNCPHCEHKCFIGIVLWWPHCWAWSLATQISKP